MIPSACWASASPTSARSPADGVGARVTSLDLSKKYLEWGRRNFLLNQIDSARHEFIHGDAFDWLGDRDFAAGATWGSISWAAGYPDVPVRFGSQRETTDAIAGAGDEAGSSATMRARLPIAQIVVAAADIVIEAARDGGVFPLERQTNPGHTEQQNAGKKPQDEGGKDRSRLVSQSCNYQKQQKKDECEV